MTLHILLDSQPFSSQPLGELSHPKPVQVGIFQWAADCEAAGHELYVPEVIDYEIRRELLRASKQSGLRRLDSLKASLNFLPITSTAMLRAAELWAQSRRSGLATGDPKKLDIDVILAAQALTLGAADVVVATSNVSHLSRFVRADIWSNIHP